MVKICPACRSTWAGGQVCSDCGTTLRDPFAENARDLPESVWRYIRLQYGARRGMLVRVLAFLIGPTVGLLLLRRALVLPHPFTWPAISGSLATGAILFLAIYWFAGKAVRIWVLRKGQLSRKRLARAILRRGLSR